MQIPLLHQQLLIQTERLRELHRAIMTHNSPVPSAEMDSLLQEIRSLYAIALELSQENARELFEGVRLAATKETVTVPTSASIDVPAPQKDLAADVTVAPGNQDNTASKAASTGPVQVSATTSSKKNGESRVADKFADHQTLAERMAEAGGKRLSDNLKASVSDLKASIGINEKFQFIQSLFKGDSVRYQAVIEQINSCPSADDAKEIVEQVSTENKWEAHASSARLFRELVNRRFSA